MVPTPGPRRASRPRTAGTTASHPTRTLRKAAAGRPASRRARWDPSNHRRFPVGSFCSYVTHVSSVKGITLMACVYRIISASNPHRVQRIYSCPFHLKSWQPNLRTSSISNVRKNPNAFLAIVTYVSVWSYYGLLYLCCQEHIID